MINPLFSIIIPSYNYEGSIAKAIKSVLEQQGDDFDLLVIDDGSTDNTAYVVQEILAKEGEVFRFIKQNNAGAAATRNRGIDETKGQYLIFLDADDEMSPNALREYRNHLSKDLIIGMLAGGHLSKSSLGHLKEHAMGHLPDDSKKKLRAYLLDKTLSLSNGAVAISRKIFECYRYPENFRASEDISMFAFILANFKVVPINAPLAIINKHNDSLRHNATHAIKAGLSVVDEVFSPQRIPEELQVLKKDYIAQRCLSLFRTLYLAGKITEARAYFHRAIMIKPLIIFNRSYVLKYIRSWFV